MCSRSLGKGVTLENTLFIITCGCVCVCVCVCVCSWCSHLIGGIPGEEFSEVRSEQSSYDILNGAVLRRTLFTTDCVCEGQ